MLGLEQANQHFYLILLTKASHMPNPGSRSVTQLYFPRTHLFHLNGLGMGMLGEDMKGVPQFPGLSNGPHKIARHSGMKPAGIKSEDAYVTLSIVQVANKRS